MASLCQVKYDEGDVYDGEWNDEGKRHGWGSLTFADGAKYVGSFSSGLFSGGVLTLADGSRYEGEFANGKYQGYGVFTRADGMKFEGQFSDGRVSGFGLITFADGTHGRPRNEGQFQDNGVVNRCSAKDAVRKAQQAAHVARGNVKN